MANAYDQKNFELEKKRFCWEKIGIFLLAITLLFLILQNILINEQNRIAVFPLLIPSPKNNEEVLNSGNGSALNILGFVLIKFPTSSVKIYKSSTIRYASGQGETFSISDFNIDKQEISVEEFNKFFSNKIPINFDVLTKTEINIFRYSDIFGRCYATKIPIGYMGEFGIKLGACKNPKNYTL